MFAIRMQSIINQLTTTTAGKRRKKSADNSNSLQDWLTTLGEGDFESFQFEIASTIIPLVV